MAQIVLQLLALLTQIVTSLMADHDEARFPILMITIQPSGVSI